MALTRINGERVVRRVIRAMPDGRRVQLYAVARWGKLYWTTDIWGESWDETRDQAVQRVCGQ